jgi:hypothetical protein
MQDFWMVYKHVKGNTKWLNLLKIKPPTVVIFSTIGGFSLAFF